MRGFSLVELSIVLVILGLLTGGILAGQSLIRAAELRRTATDLARFQTGVYSFQDKYFALPGDMRNATSFWGAQLGTTAEGPDPTCASTSIPATTAATCNGDGDGLVEGGGTTGIPNQEMHRAWQHLANAGLIEGQYAGIGRNALYGTDNFGFMPGWNSPASRISNGKYFIFTRPGNAGPPHEFSTLSRTTHIIFTSGFWDPIVRPEEAWNIDTKLDDGRPGIGRILGNPQGSSVAPNCSTTNVANTAEYNLTFQSNGCAIWTIISR